MDAAAVAQTRRSGALISLVAVLFGAVFAVGVLRRSYWALAIPVSIGTGSALYVVLWIGRALMTTPAEPAQ